MRISDWSSDVCSSDLYSRRAVELVWSTSRGLTVALGLLTLVAGLLPAGVAWIGALIIDAVVAASRTVSAGEPLVLAPVLTLIAIEAGLVMALAGAQRGIRSEEHTSELQSLMRISYAVFCLKQNNHT